MPQPSTNAAPSNLASIPGFVSRAGFFWRGGAVTLALVFGVSAAVAYAMGDVFESESTLEIVEGSAPKDPAQPREAPIDVVQRALFSTASLETLTREIEPPPNSETPFPAQVEHTRESIQVRSRSERSFAVAFHAGTPELAQRGADWLARAAVRSFERGSEPSGEEARRTKFLEERTKELAAFVAEHPEVALSGPAPTAAPSASAIAMGASSAAPAPADSALLVLQQQRATLEWRVADAEKKEATGTNPYENTTDKASLQRMLAQVRAAIAARQAVTLRRGAEAASASSAGRPAPSPPAKTPASVALQVEWQRLLEAVVDAQQHAPSKREAGAQGEDVLRIVEKATLPVRPIKPDKRLIYLLGLAAGVWMGILWAFIRVALGHDIRAGWPYAGDEEDGAEGDPPPPEPRRAPTGWVGTAAFDETMIPNPEIIPASSAPPVTARDGTAAQLMNAPGIPYQPGGTVLRAPGAGPQRIPRELLATAPGVIDVSRAYAETGTAPARPRAIETPPAQPQWRNPIPAAGMPPRSPGDVRPGAYSQHHRETERGIQVPMRATGVTQTFVSPTASWGPSPPAGTTQASPYGSPAPNAAGPSYGLAVRGRMPEEAFTVRDVPFGWAPDPSILHTGSMNELITIRDQVFRLAANGCFVIGITSAPNATSDKSCVAAQLASLLAAPGRARVLLIEANFDRPQVHRLMALDMPFSQGFSEQLRRRMTPAQRVPWTLVRCAQNFHVLGEGLVRSPGLLSSVQFGEALQELRGYFDVIVADGPIAEGTVDTCAFDALMEGIVLVGAVGSAPAKLLDELSKWFGKKQLSAVISADATAEQRIEFGLQKT